jgi:hypothetical protein
MRAKVGCKPIVIRDKTFALVLYTTGVEQRP